MRLADVYFTDTFPDNAAASDGHALIFVTDEAAHTRWERYNIRDRRSGGRLERERNETANIMGPPINARTISPPVAGALRWAIVKLIYRNARRRQSRFTTAPRSRPPRLALATGFGVSRVNIGSSPFNGSSRGRGDFDSRSWLNSQRLVERDRDCF